MQSFKLFITSLVRHYLVSICLSVCLFVCLFVCLSVCLFVCLFVYLSVCLFEFISVLIIPVLINVLLKIYICVCLCVFSFLYWMCVCLLCVFFRLFTWILLVCLTVSCLSLTAIRPVSLFLALTFKCQNVWLSLFFQNYFLGGLYAQVLILETNIFPLEHRSRNKFKSPLKLCPPPPTTTTKNPFLRVF